MTSRTAGSAGARCGTGPTPRPQSGLLGSLQKPGEGGFGSRASASELHTYWGNKRGGVACVDSAAWQGP